MVVMLASPTAHRHLAGTRRLAVDVHGAGAALGDAAAIFRAGQAEPFAQHPEQGRVGFDVDWRGAPLMVSLIDGGALHEGQVPAGAAA